MHGRAWALQLDAIKSWIINRTGKVAREEADQRNNGVRFRHLCSICGQKGKPDLLHSISILGKTAFKQSTPIAAPHWLESFCRCNCHAYKININYKHFIWWEWIIRCDCGTGCVCVRMCVFKCRVSRCIRLGHNILRIHQQLCALLLLSGWFLRSPNLASECSFGYANGSD